MRGTILEPLDLILNGDFETVTVLLVDKTSLQLKNIVVMPYGCEGTDSSEHQVFVPWTFVARITGK